MKPRLSTPVVPPPTIALCSVALGAVLLALAPRAAQAQAQDASTATSTAPAPRVPVGDATQSLLAMQREGRMASPTPRPIAGDVAQLSYQRYLDSFDGAKHPIPAQFGTTVKASDSGGR